MNRDAHLYNNIPKIEYNKSDQEAILYIYLSIYLQTYLPSYLFIYLSIYQSINLCIYLSIYQATYLAISYICYSYLTIQRSLQNGVIIV